MLMPREFAAAGSHSPSMTLLTAKLELGGAWGGSATEDAATVIERARAACLAGVTLLSDRQPHKLRVDDQSGSNPSIWLHPGAATTGWIMVTVGDRDWCKLAYQFGHELGHVLCNSWAQDAKPRNPCQWIEEALVEAFSLRGLRLLADDWRHTPPFLNDADFAISIERYGARMLDGYRALNPDGASGLRAWFTSHEAFLKENGGVDAASGAVSTMLALLESDAAMITDMGALNRWPERSGVPVHDYLRLWKTSCSQLNAPGRLPARLQKLLAKS
jgi:hypothetical protein